jgi:thioredoxin
MKGSHIIIATASIFVVVGAALVWWASHGDNLNARKSQVVLEINDENFQEQVVEASRARPVVVDFYAEWCAPCRLLDPIFEKVARDSKGKAVFGKIDIDENLIAKRLGVHRIPAVFVIRNGEVKKTFLGVVPEETLVKAITKHSDESS